MGAAGVYTRSNQAEPCIDNLNTLPVHSGRSTGQLGLPDTVAAQESGRSRKPSALPQNQTHVYDFLGMRGRANPRATPPQSRTGHTLTEFQADREYG